MHITSPHQRYLRHCRGAPSSFEERHVTSQSRLDPEHKQIPLGKSRSARLLGLCFFVITLKDVNKGAGLIRRSASILINKRVLAHAVSAAGWPCALRR